MRWRGKDSMGIRVLSEEGRGKGRRGGGGVVKGARPLQIGKSSRGAPSFDGGMI